MTAPFKKISTWRERIGQTADFPLHVPTDVERAMVAEIADLRALVPTRATEGRTQTSEAGVFVPVEVATLIDRAFLPHNPNKLRSAAPSVVDAAKLFKQILAAQSADNTAPGAPTDQEHADFEHWYVTHIDGAEIGSTDCAARWSTWLARSGGFYKAPSDWKIAPTPWNALAAPSAQQLDDLIAEHRIAITPENEGGFHAHVYHDQDAPVATGYGATPRAAVDAAIADQQPAKPTEA